MEHIHSEGVTNATYHAICVWSVENGKEIADEIYHTIFNLSVYYNSLADSEGNKMDEHGRLDLNAAYEKQVAAKTERPKDEDLN